MKIVHLNKNDVQGGAARSAYRLHKGLQLLGRDSRMFVLSQSSDDASVTSVTKASGFVSRVQRGIQQYRLARELQRYRDPRSAGYELFSDDRSEYASEIEKHISSFDIINLHWVPGFIDYQKFFDRIPRMKPVVWTFHDMNAFTGGCHYDLGCGRYLGHCGSCPQLGSQDERDLSFRIRQRKSLTFSRLDASQLNIVTPSQWLAREAGQSPLLRKFPISVIPYGLDTDEFAPRERTAIRSLLGIPQNAKVVLFVSEGLDNQRKGFAHLIDALIRCAETVPNLLLLSIGSNPRQQEMRVPWIHVGSLNNDRFLSMVYNAADVFVICSLQDNLPNTALEAMACGIPVVGVKVGGIPDMVRNGVTGSVVPPAEPAALASAIGNLLNDTAKLQEMKSNCRRIAVGEYSLELQARRYSELYEQLIRRKLDK